MLQGGGRYEPVGHRQPLSFEMTLPGQNPPPFGGALVYRQDAPVEPGAQRLVNPLLQFLAALARWQDPSGP